MVTEDYASKAEAAALICLLWSEADEQGQSFDVMFSPADLKGSDRRAFYAEVRDFLALCEREGLDLSALDPGQVGHDFTLTRNGHGAGFWDRGWGELGDKMTALCKPYGEANLYAGDDGFLHLS